MPLQRGLRNQEASAGGPGTGEFLPLARLLQSRALTTSGMY